MNQHPQRQYVRFTGDFAQLKKLGYDFQKLYAANYQQWNKGSVRVWRKGSDVTLDQYLDEHFAQLVALLIERKGQLPYETSRMFTDMHYLRFYVNTKTGAMTFDESEYKAWFLKIADKTAEQDPNFNWGLWEAKVVSPEIMEPVLELYRLGWLEVAIADSAL